MKKKLNILVVCGRNERRSRTAEYVFKNDARFNIRSGGLSPKSNRQFSEKDLLWADIFFVMTDGQSARIQGVYRDMDLPPIHVLDILDNYEYLDNELIALLNERINGTLKFEYKM